MHVNVVLTTGSVLSKIKKNIHVLQCFSGIITIQNVMLRLIPDTHLLTKHFNLKILCTVYKLVVINIYTDVEQYLSF